MVTSGANCRRPRNAIGGPVACNGIYATESAGIVTALFEKGIIISSQTICCSGYEIVAPDRQKDVFKSPFVAIEKESGTTWNSTVFPDILIWVEPSVSTCPTVMPCRVKRFLALIAVSFFNIETFIKLGSAPVSSMNSVRPLSCEELNFTRGSELLSVGFKLATRSSGARWPASLFGSSGVAPLVAVRSWTGESGRFPNGESY